MKKKLTCIVCPMGCQIEVDTDTQTVTGNTCKRGEVYGLGEVTNPVRVITSTVKLEGSAIAMLPVKTNGPIPKGFNFKCMEEINKVTAKAPIKVGDVIIANVLDTGVDIVAGRTIE